MKLPQIFLLMLVVFPWVILATRRRVSFTRFLSTKTDSDILESKPVRSRIECSVKCLKNPVCLSASYCKTGDGYTCQLTGSYVEGNCSRLAAGNDCSQTAMVDGTEFEFDCDEGRLSKLPCGQSFIIETPSSSRAKQTTNTKPKDAQGRFVAVEDGMSDGVILDNQNKNTAKKTLYDLKLFDNFLKVQNEFRQMHEIPPNELDTLLCKFFISVRKTNGENYEPNSLTGFQSSIERSLKRWEHGYSLTSSLEFSRSREVLKGRKIELKKEGRGNLPRRADPIGDEEIESLWQSGSIGISNQVDPCENGGTFYLHNRTCHCAEGFVGHYCQRRYRDCTETPKIAKFMQYTIQPFGSKDVLEWVCAQGSGRVSQIYPISFNVNYTLPWQQMKRSYPFFEGFSFLGLENLHQLTKQGVYHVRIILVVSQNDVGDIYYRNLRVDPEAQGYALHWDSVEWDKTYYAMSEQYLDGFGGAGDETKNLNGARFGTYDNDVNGCARANSAGWWFNPIGCTKLRFHSKGLYWPTNRNGTVEMELMTFVLMILKKVYWHVEDDLVL